jgi:hypothetical protein
LRPGEWEPTPDVTPEKKHDDQSDDDKKHPKHEKSLAAKRGEDWALRNAARGSVGVTRPIRVACYADRLVVTSDCDSAGDKVVAVDARGQLPIDSFISVVWEHIERWGIAGRSMYWRPVLQVSVAPGADGRFAELAARLEGSGLTVERK